MIEFTILHNTLLCLLKSFGFLVNKNVLLLLVFESSMLVSLQLQATAYETKVQTVSMKTEHGVQLMQHWTEQAVGSFMAAVANKNLKTKPKHILLEFGDCTRNSKSIPQQAKCVSKLLRNQFTGKKYMKPCSKNRLQKYSQSTRTSPIKRSHRKAFVDSFGLYNSSNKNVGEKPAVVQRQNYNLLSTDSGQMSPLGGVAQILMKSVLAAKKKTETRPWQETIARLQNSASEKINLQPTKQPKTLKDLQQIILRNMEKRGTVEQNLKYFDESRQKAILSPMEKSGRVQNQLPQKLVNLLRDGLKLTWSIAGKNTSEFTNKTIKAISPRLFSVVPEEEIPEGDVIKLLSPSLLSLHKEGKGLEKLTSLPSLLKGFNNKDQQAWMNLIMEAAGVTEEADRVDKVKKACHSPCKILNENHQSSLQNFQKRYQDEARAADGTPLYFTKENVTRMYGQVEERKITVFEHLNGNLSTDQIHELNKTGFALLTPYQLILLYGPKSPYKDVDALGRFKNLNNSNLQHTIEDDIHKAAQLKSFSVRLKRQTPSSILTPTSFAQIRPNAGGAIVLSPIIFSPAILAPAVLGPVVLSPLLFVPVVLSPRAMSPLILSPLAFVPFILSPVVLHPVILSPGVFVPVVLSPVALSPFIMSPQVFSPTILSPFVLSPAILNPKAGSPVILSPFALSPSILSPQAFGALILSPYAMSPGVLSPLVAYTVLLSPSYLS